MPLPKWLRHFSGWDKSTAVLLVIALFLITNVCMPWTWWRKNYLFSVTFGWQRGKSHRVKTNRYYCILDESKKQNFATWIQYQHHMAHILLYIIRYSLRWSHKFWRLFPRWNELLLCFFLWLFNYWSVITTTFFLGSFPNFFRGRANPKAITF